jgi:hypothetical protein
MRASRATCSAELHPATHHDAVVVGYKTPMPPTLLHIAARTREASARVVAPHYSHIPTTFLQVGICEGRSPERGSPLFVLTEEIRDDTARRLRMGSPAAGQCR